MKTENRKECNAFIQDEIISVSRATKRKMATITLAIDDDLAKKIIEAKFSECEDGFPRIMRLCLNWLENQSK